MKGKPWYESKTLWLAVAQGLVGVIAAVLSEYPEIKAAGALAFAKSLLDAFLRFRTDERVRL